MKLKSKVFLSITFVEGLLYTELCAKCSSGAIIPFHTWGSSRPETLICPKKASRTCWKLDSNLPLQHFTEYQLHARLCSEYFSSTDPFNLPANLQGSTTVVPILGEEIRQREIQYYAQHHIFLSPKPWQTHVQSGVWKEQEGPPWPTGSVQFRTELGTFVLLWEVEAEHQGSAVSRREGCGYSGLTLTISLHVNVLTT